METAGQAQVFDVILANVNRHIIEANLEALTQSAKPCSILVLSGLLIEDQLDITNLTSNLGWNFVKAQPLNGWVSLMFSRYC